MDKSLAILLGKISQYVHGDAELAELGGPSVKLYQDHELIPSSFAGILRYSDKTVLAFAGTISNPFNTGVRDWLANFVATPAPSLIMGLPGLVHLGFSDQLRLLSDDLLADLKNDYVRPLYVTGHSQGAAVAALATKFLELNNIEVAATYTFAAPFPGDGIFASSVRTPVFRMEFGDDIVPHVALHGLPLPVELALKASPELKDVFGNISTTIGYTPVGQLTYGAPGQPLRVNVSSAEEKKLTLQRLPRLGIAGGNLWAHHHLTNYIGMLS
jgi:hypothetical protein